MTLRRRTLLGAGTALVAGCSREGAPPLQGAWVGATPERGHRLRDAAALGPAAVQRRAGVLVVGGGVAGLAAARGFLRAGVDDVHLLELEDSAGGNSRGHVLAGMACPLAAHYLPLPAPESHEVTELLFELGLLRTEFGRTVPDERHLCHSPQERLFIDGAWVEGLLPPAEPDSETAAQYRRFAAAVAALQVSDARGRSFALPTHRAAHAPPAELGRMTFDAWLDRRGLSDARLRWYLDYCCRDDYGAGSAIVSAWAGVHYFASRHGFHAPGDDSGARDAVFTWPEGNAWLTTRLAAPLGERLHTGRTVLRVDEGRHEVQVWAWNEASLQLESWSAPRVVLAVPLFVAARLLSAPPPALREAAALLQTAPWLVANLHLSSPLLDRPGAAPSWDNVIYGSRALGYVDAMHQSLRPHAGATVITAYQALLPSERAALLVPAWQGAAQRVIDELLVAHPDLPRRLQRIELARWGHAMAVPRPGVHGNAALAALRRQRGRLRFAHADLAGYSVFEEAFTAGIEAAS